jgi:hypothetical protein
MPQSAKSKQHSKKPLNDVNAAHFANEKPLASNEMIKKKKHRHSKCQIM